MSQVLETVGLSEDDLTIVDPGFAGVELILAGKLDADSPPCAPGDISGETCYR